MQNKLSKFSLKLALFLMPIIAFCVAVPIAMSQFPMHFFDGEYAMYQQQKDYIYNNNDYNRVLITGDSKAKVAFLPSLLSDETYNLSLGGITPLENYYLKEYLENRQVPETVFIAFNPFHYMVFDCFWTRSVYFHRLSENDLNDIFETSLPYDDTDEILTDFDKKVLEYKYYSVKNYGKAFVKSFFEDRYKKNSDMYNDMYETKGQVYFGTLEYCDGYSQEAKVKNFEVLDIIDCYFHKTIDMCLDYGINVIIETIPMNKATYDVCTKNYLSDYSNYMKNLQSEYPQIIVNTDLYYWDNEYFGDAAHFNSKGTEKYSKYIKEKYSGVFGNYSS